MSKENKENKEKCSCGCHGKGAASNTIYGLGFVGAAIYFISKATSFWMGVIGIFKSIVWPGFIVYELLKFFHL